MDNLCKQNELLNFDLKDATNGQTKIYIQRQIGYIYAKLKLPDTLTCIIVFYNGDIILDKIDDPK